MKLMPTASQTVGPYFIIGMEYLCSKPAPEPSADADTITVYGRLLDGEGAPVPDAMLELWQPEPSVPNATVEYDAANSARLSPLRFARVATDEQGAFSFVIHKPVPVPFDEQRMQAPHLAVLVFMRGLLRNLITRMYLPDEPAISADPVLELVPQERRHTLIARHNPQSPGRLEWNIMLQGEDETVFFAW